MSKDLQRDFVVLTELDRGRFGTVYKCVSRSNSDDTFAVKSIDKLEVGAGDFLDAQCISSEAKIVHRLNPHPNIVTLHKVYEDENTLHLLFELCDDADLHSRLRRFALDTDSLTESTAPMIMRQLMQAVAHCHRLGVAHRDIKPENILFEGRCGQLKLADFGSAEFFKEGELMSGVVGTPYYVAPEVVAGRKYNEKVDVWSCGVILYMMLSGNPPFDGGSEVEIFEAVLRGNLRFPRQYFQSVSREAKDLLRRMLCKDVSRRLSAEQVLSHPWFNMFAEKATYVSHPHTP